MKTRPRTAAPFTVPATIAGLWALHPLVPIKDEDAYDAASDVCTRLAVRRLNAVQREYFRELTALVEAYEDAHGLLEKTEHALRKLAAHA
ncbi:MAG: hypothetical protein ACOYMN_13405 [Roseimicrobium sp.]